MLKTPVSFMDRHLKYSEEIVGQALTNILENYQRYESDNPGACNKCKERQEELGALGLPLHIQ